MSDQSQSTPSALPFLRNEKILGYAYQGLVLAIVLAIAAYLMNNAADNLQRQHVASGFAYLDRQSNFGIGESVIDVEPTDSYGRMFVAGLVNTIRVSLIACIASVFLGTLLGCCRLSLNPLVARVSGGIVEALRNTPLLLQLFFWYALLLLLPPLARALSPVSWLILSNRGLAMPAPVLDSGHWPVFAAFGFGLACCLIAGRWARRTQERTGRRPRIWPSSILFLIVLPWVVSILDGSALHFEVPARKGLSLFGGMTLTPEFVALCLGLAINNSASVAEIVRGGVQSVGRGQWDAGRALGFSRGRILRLIIMPQAMRVIIPPLTSSFLSTTKSSSLAIAIGYPDIVSVSNTTFNQTGQALEAIALFMLTYLTLSLLISLFMNWYNTAIAMRGSRR